MYAPRIPDRTGTPRSRSTSVAAADRGSAPPGRSHTGGRCAIRHLTIAAIALAATLAAAPAAQAAATPRALVSVHNGYAAYHHWRAAAGVPSLSYGYLADRHTTTNARRWQIATVWWQRAGAAYRYWRSHRSLVPASFIPAIRCISENEEYGFPDEGGYNTPAGYFGMPSLPSEYPGSASAVGRYGDSWLAIPFAAQLPIAYAEWQTYGWSPWSTAPGCGLG